MNEALRWQAAVGQIADTDRYAWFACGANRVKSPSK
jgi:hypothetical protein